MLWNDKLEEFLDWFVSPKTTNETDLKAALMSVLSESWSVVEVRLKVALHDEKLRHGPVAQDIVPGRKIEPWIPTPEALKKYDLAEKKERFLAAENERRR